MFVFITLQLLVLTSVRSAIDLPQDIPKCTIDDPKVGNCIISVSNKLRPRFHEGINEIGIPSYNPLVLSPFNVSQESDMMNYSASFHDLTIRGLENYDITDLQYDPKTMTFKGRFELDSILIQSPYNLSGRLLFIPVEGNGTFYETLGAINGRFEITGKILKRKNLDYYDPKYIKVNLTIDDMAIRFEGMFDGNKELADMTNTLINRNSKAILEAVMPTIEVLSEQFVMRYFKWLTRKYPYYNLFAHS